MNVNRIYERKIRLRDERDNAVRSISFVARHFETKSFIIKTSDYRFVMEQFQSPLPTSKGLFTPDQNRSEREKDQ